MRRVRDTEAGRLLVALVTWLFFAAPCLAHADGTVAFWGNYYKERSTRVISPMVSLGLDLPEETSAEVSYLIDNITSASGIRANADGNPLGARDPWQETRQEVRLDLSKRIFGFLTPGALARYSYEPDYTSFTYGLSLAASLFEDNTVLTVSAQRQNDAIFAAYTNFEDTLDTWRLAAGVTQTLLPNLAVGGSFEAQLLDGYTENPYRNEEHPRTRDRFAAGFWAAYRFRDPGTTVRASYRYYWDDWSVEAHSFELQVFQRITADLEIVPLVRFHGQSGVNFRSQIDRDGFTYYTSDPKLSKLGNTAVGLRVVWRLSFLKDTFLDPFQSVELHPRYQFFAQRNELELNPIRIVAPEDGAQNSFGDAHIAQLGVVWPF